MRLRRGLRVEFLGDEAVSFDRSGEVVHQVTGGAVSAVKRIQDGVDPSELPQDLTGEVENSSRLDWSQTLQQSPVGRS